LGGRVPADEVNKRASWSTARVDTQFDWTTNRNGIYTVAVQYIDREANRSPLSMVVLMLQPAWYANAFITVPASSSALALLGWALVARVLYVRKLREAERLRMQLLAEEHRAREAAEASARALATKNGELEQARREAD